MKTPIYELYVCTEVPQHEINSIITMYNGELCTGRELPPEEIKRRGYDRRERRWEGRREDMERLMDKWISKPSTLSAVIYDDDGYMIASYEKEDA